MRNLFDKNFPSPEPIINKNGSYISSILEKKAAVVSFLDGYAKKILNPNDCYEVGINTAKLHLITKDLKGKRENKLSINSWRKIYNKVKKDCSKIHANLPKVIEKNLDEIEKGWPKNIPSGIIHADLFPDNIFFKEDKLSGIIDYYFSCYDFYAFEIAICLNALCFEGKNENLSFNVTKAKKFIDGYSSIRKLTEEEKKSLKILCQGAAIRFLLTRVFDYLNLIEGAIVKIKDPVEYLKRLEFHDSVKNYNDYFF
jgi:homoserine kinase type II